MRITYTILITIVFSYFLYGCFCQEEKPIIAVPLSATVSGAGYYFDMEVGTPGQQVRMLLDLTSSVVSIPVSPWCESNPNCYANQTYFPNESTTPAEIAMCTSQCSYCGEIAVRGVQQNSCFVVLYYNNLNVERSASLQAVEVTDLVSVQTLSIRTRFAGFFQQSAAFSATDFDGILGMAPYSDFLGLDPWFPTISDSGQVNNQFSFCFSSVGGVLLFGGSDASLYKGFLSFTSLISSKVYTVSQEAFQISGNSFSLTEAELNPTIIDSTSPDTVISNQAYQLVLSKINSLYCSKPIPPIGLCGTKTFFNGYCFAIPGGNLEGYPSFSFVLTGNVNLTLNPEDYLILQPEGYFCNTLVGATYYQSGTILGINILRKYYTTIDLDTQTVGFAESTNCGTAQYIIEYQSGDSQTSPAGKSLQDPFVAIVRRFNDSMPASNVTVQWKITQGGGEISDSTSTSDENGIVSVTLELGESIGSNIVSVSLQNAVGSPIVFTANGVKGVWFYLSNVLSVLALTGGLIAIAWYDRKHGKGHGHGHGDKKKKVETFSDLVNDTDNEKVTLLEWARLHDQPVREPNQTAAYHSQVYSQRTR